MRKKNGMKKEKEIATDVFFNDRCEKNYAQNIGPQRKRERDEEKSMCV